MSSVSSQQSIVWYKLKTMKWLNPFVFTFDIRPSYNIAAAKSLQLCLTLCSPTDSSPPGYPIPGILQARTLEWVPFPSPMRESEKWKWSRPVVSDS